MAIIEPARHDVEQPRQIKKHAAGLRFWHWANMIVITGSLLTVLINSTITDPQSTATLAKEQLETAGISVSAKQAGAVAHALEDKVWDVHVYFGYVLAGLLFFRLLMEFFQLADQKFMRKLKSAYVQFNTIKQNRMTARHELTVKLIYAAFYLLLIIMVVTGLCLAFQDNLAMLKSIRRPVKQVHGFCMYLVLAFIAVHLAGVFLAERKEGKGIVSDMINGGSENAG